MWLLVIDPIKRFMLTLGVNYLLHNLLQLTTGCFILVTLKLASYFRLLKFQLGGYFVYPSCLFILCLLPRSSYSQVSESSSPKNMKLL